MSDYTETILKYASDNSRTGILENADGTGEVGLTGHEVGKRLAVRFTLNTNADLIEKIRFQVFGCGYTIAACAAAAELSEGCTLQQIQEFKPDTINLALDNDLPRERSYCAELANLALQAAVASALSDACPVRADLTSAELNTDDHGPRISRNDPLYRALMATRPDKEIMQPDRQMFAGLLTLVSREAGAMNVTLGLSRGAFDAVLSTYFPGFDRSLFDSGKLEMSATPPEINSDVLDVLLAHIADDTEPGIGCSAEWLARIIAARAALPGHLWQAMGFFERRELTAAIRRHLPSLAEANKQGMRWKRYLFKQVCERNGGVMCKSPNCGDCSDYVICFAPEDA